MGAAGLGAAVLVLGALSLCVGTAGALDVGAASDGGVIRALLTSRLFSPFSSSSHSVRSADEQVLLQQELSCGHDCHRRGRCVAGVCECFLGWQGQYCEQQQEWCPENCLGRGVCDEATLTCRCNTGFRGPNCSEVVVQCPRSCSGHGLCVERTGTCTCAHGFTGADCSIAVLNACPSQCSMRGSCLQGRCHCDEGFTGSACETAVPVDACLHSCSGHGSCVNGKCVCEVGFVGDDCSEITTLVNETSSDLVCDRLCSGHGVCVRGECVCAFGWYGPACNTNYFACPNHCSGHGACAADFTCNCAVGYAGESCERVVANTCGNNCNGLGRCSFDNVWGFLDRTARCECYDSSLFAGPHCESLLEPLPCPANCSGHGVCNSGVCACNAEFGGAACDVPLFTCPQNCSGKGLCLHGRCECFDGWSGRACAHQEIGCPNGCSGHGHCHNGVCVCSTKWTGEACNATCQANCTHGHCVHGVCDCLAGWTGPTCSARDVCPNDCNDQGRCTDGVCYCQAGWAGEDCSSQGWDENTQPPTCEAVGGCHAHGECVWDEIARKGKCECGPGWLGVACDQEVLGGLLVTELDEGNCTSVVATQCVAQWISKGCPSPHHFPSAPCVHYANCEAAARAHGRCDHVSPPNTTQTNTTTLSPELCAQVEPASCAQAWIANGCPSALSPECEVFRPCVLQASAFCPGASHNEPAVPTNTTTPSGACESDQGEACVELWVEAGCPVLGFNPIPECALFVHCHCRAMADGRCQAVGEQ